MTRIHRKRLALFGAISAFALFVSAAPVSISFDTGGPVLSEKSAVAGHGNSHSRTKSQSKCKSNCR